MSLVLAVFLLFLVLPAQAGPQRLVVISSFWAPFAGGNSTHPGIFNEIVSKAFALSGIGVDYASYPWARCTLNIKLGKHFAGMPFSVSPERNQFAYFSKAIFTTSNPVIYNKKLNPDYDYQGLESLREYKLIGLLGWSYLNQWKRAGLAHKQAKDPLTAFQLIALNRGQLTVFDEFAGKYLLKKHPYLQESIGMSETSYARNKMGLMVSKKYPHSKELLTIFNTNLETLIASGFIDKLAQKYNVPRQFLLPEGLELSCQAQNSENIRALNSF